MRCNYERIGQLEGRREEREEREERREKRASVCVCERERERREIRR